MSPSKISLVSLFILLPGLVFGFALTVYAQPIGLTITPLKYDITANPGETVEKTITVINPNEGLLTVVAEFQDFRVIEEKGENTIQWLPPDIENPYKMIDWIIINQAPIRLGAKGEATVPFKIRIPRNAGVGGHYAALFFKAELESAAGGIGAVPRVGALILLNVQGDISKTGEFLDFQAPFLVNKGPVKFAIKFKNTGTAHYKITANIDIKNIFGQKTTVSSQEKFVYPGTERTIEAEWNKKRPIGIFRAKATIIDGEGKKYSQKQWFIGFPLKPLLIALGAVIVLCYAYRLLKRKFKIVKVA